MFPKLTTAKRVQMAKRKTDRVVDHLLYLIALHESNAVVVHSDTLSKQIPRSRAAHAFNLFRQCMSHFEIVRLCALWDPAGPDRESIPTIVQLLDDHPDVIDALVKKARTTALVGVRDPAQAALRPSIEKQARRKTAEARDKIADCIRRGQKIARSRRLDSVRHVRDKHLVHALSKTRRKKRPVLRVRLGDERKLLLDSIPLVRALYRWVNGGETDFEFDESRKNAREHAEELWKNCAFNIQSRGKPPAQRS